MEKILNKLIKKVILRKYPQIKSIDKIYTFTNPNKWMVNITTYDCLDSEVMMSIDSDIKDLFKMVNSDTKFIKKSISSWFRCDENELYDFKHKSAMDTAWEMVQYDEDYEDELSIYADHLKKQLIDSYGDIIQDYFNRVFDDKNFKDDGYKYIFVKHSKLNGGQGFSEGFPTWGELVTNYGYWFPIDWWKVKERLDELENGGRLLYLKPGDKHNDMGYYFTIKKVKK